MKIDEMKETSSNRDISNGGVQSGATAAAAIAALQEAGNKMSRDMIQTSYRKYTQIGYLVIELIRQFYDEQRTFRITGDDGTYEFSDYSNANIRGQQTGVDGSGMPMTRVPVFDITIKAQKRSPFAREAQNQRAMELYSAGFFNPDNATPALAALEMMEFEGIEKIREKVGEGQTLMNMVMQLQQQVQQLMQLVQLANGRPAAPMEAPAEDGGSQQTAPGRGSIGGQALDAQSGNAMSSYTKRILDQGSMDMNKGAEA